MKKITGIAVLSVSSILFGCVSTPEPNPIAAVQPGDHELTCEYMEAEYKGNTEAAKRKIDKNNASDAKDVALGLLIWPGLADFNNAPGHEGNALLDRNARLKNLAEVQKCDTSGWPEQPKRY
ncbi:hypothetical protein [Biformimicrobium ophioploci]|nr:hypothetical protein [Microbulbifer sp. NKW57]